MVWGEEFWLGFGSWELEEVEGLDFPSDLLDLAFMAEKFRAWLGQRALKSES